MGRVSLTEAYDDRSVIAKLNEMDKRVKENTTVVTSAEASAKASAQAAQETADRFAGSVGAVVQNANAQINASKAQVDQAKAEVDAAVTTVDGYDARLTAVEDADAHNVKLEGNQAISGVKTVPTEATGSHSQQIANSAKIGAELDNYAPMLRTSNNQVFSGIKKAGPNGFIRKSSATMDLISPPAGTVNDETYVLEDINGKTVVSNFNSFTSNAQTIYQISTKYPFEENGVIKTVTGYIWLAVYNDRAVLFLRYTDKNGVSHLKEISRVSETEP